MKVTYIISILLIIAFSSCSEYNDSINPKDNFPPPETTEDYLPILPEIKPTIPIRINSNYSIKLSNDTTEITKDILYKIEKNYDKLNHVNSIGSIEDSDDANSLLNFNRDDITLLGNIFYSRTQSIKGNFDNQSIKSDINKEYVFKERKFSEIQINNQTITKVIDFGNSVEISNKKSINSDLFYSTITANFNELGRISSGKIITNNNSTINFYLKTDDTNIKEITITNEQKILGNLKLNYDNKINPFSLSIVDNYNTNKSLGSMIIADLYSNSTIDENQNAKHIALELMKLCDFSPNNLKSAIWNNINVLNNEYQYNNKNFPTKITRSQSFMNDSDFISQLGYNVETLNGTTTITYL